MHEKGNGHTVKIGAAAAAAETRSLSMSAFDCSGKSQRSSQSNSSVYVKHEVTVKVEDGWERRSYYSSIT